MSEVTTSLADCAEHLDQSLGPLDEAQRALHQMIVTASGLSDPRLGELEGLLADVQRVQYAVAGVRDSLDAAAES